MIRYHIRVNVGNENKTIQYHFFHKNWSVISQSESDAAFNDAVTELNRIYKNYGRFATQTGVTKLFESFGFERTVED